jgi:hypothetical protein
MGGHSFETIFYTRVFPASYMSALRHPPHHVVFIEDYNYDLPYTGIYFPYDTCLV